MDANDPPSLRAGEVTALLAAWSAGDSAALDRLLPLVYDELRRTAARARRREQPGYTLPTTALVHETYLRLVGQDHAQWRNRAQFFAVSARIMRRILVDQARRRGAEKRGGGRPLRLITGFDIPVEADDKVLAVDQALKALEMVDSGLARLVELRFFAGLTVEETAAAQGVSPATVSREWAVARAWLQRELGPQLKSPNAG